MISKNEILHALEKEGKVPFDDPTNRDQYFLRARLRQTIFPRLNQEFGKEVQNNLIEIGEEASELVNYFQARLFSLLDSLIRGPWGISMDFQAEIPIHFIEMKYFIRLLCQKEQFFISREMINQIADALRRKSK